MLKQSELHCCVFGLPFLPKIFSRMTFRIYTSLAHSTMNNSGKKNLTEQEVKQVISALIDWSILVEDE